MNDDMSNKELADWIETWFVGGKHHEIARRLRELPEPESKPESMTLQQLIEKHECLSDELRFLDHLDVTAWRWIGPVCNLITSECLLVVRGIVERICDEAYKRTGDTHYIRPWTGREGMYRARVGRGWLTKEPMPLIEVMDELLTAIEEGQR